MSDLHARIMNLPCSKLEPIVYRMGHRDARHEAAELANEAADELERKDAAIAELVGALTDAKNSLWNYGCARAAEKAERILAKYESKQEGK